MKAKGGSSKGQVCLTPRQLLFLCYSACPLSAVVLFMQTVKEDCWVMVGFHQSYTSRQSLVPQCYSDCLQNYLALQGKCGYPESSARYILFEEHERKDTTEL